MRVRNELPVASIKKLALPNKNPHRAWRMEHGVKLRANRSKPNSKRKEVSAYEPTKSFG